MALTGSLMGTLLTCVLAIIFTNVLKLDGGDTPYIVPLLSQSAMTIDPRRCLSAWCSSPTPAR